METTVFYVAQTYETIFNPTIVEKFDNKVDAESYAALMCKTQKRNYVVLEIVTEWIGSQSETEK